MISDKKRIAWACRRGMLELDLILMRFLDNRFESLSQEEQSAFVALLSASDQDLFDWFLQKKAPPETHRVILSLLNNKMGLNLETQY